MRDSEKRGQTDGRTTCVKIVITSGCVTVGRPCGSKGELRCTSLPLLVRGSLDYKSKTFSAPGVFSILCWRIKNLFFPVENWRKLTLQLKCWNNSQMKVASINEQCRLLLRRILKPPVSQQWSKVLYILMLQHYLQTYGQLILHAVFAMSVIRRHNTGTNFWAVISQG